MTNIVEKNLFAEWRREAKACSNRLIKYVRSGKIGNCITNAATKKANEKPSEEILPSAGFWRLIYDSSD